MHIGGCGDVRVDQAGILVDTNVDLKALVPLVALLGLVNLRIALAILVLGGARRCYQSKINYNGMEHRHESLAEMGFDGVKNLRARHARASPASD